MIMRTALIISAAALSLLVWGCGKQTFHHDPMPDPGPYMIHFHELDADGDEVVTWDEFKQRFPDTTEAVFNAVDQNGDGMIDHDEWHAFKAAHG